MIVISLWTFVCSFSGGTEDRPGLDSGEVRGRFIIIFRAAAASVWADPQLPVSGLTPSGQHSAAAAGEQEHCQVFVDMMR